MIFVRDANRGSNHLTQCLRSDTQTKPQLTLWLNTPTFNRWDKDKDKGCNQSSLSKSKNQRNQRSLSKSPNLSHQRLSKILSSKSLQRRSSKSTFKLNTSMFKRLAKLNSSLMPKRKIFLMSLEPNTPYLGHSQTLETSHGL